MALNKLYQKKKKTNKNNKNEEGGGGAIQYLRRKQLERDGEQAVKEYTKNAT
jgi:hypothetical protein